MSSNGDGRESAVASTEQAWLEATAGALFVTLTQFYPLDDPRKLSNIAMRTAKEQRKLRPLTEAYIKKEYTHIEFQLHEPKNIIMPGMTGRGLKLLAPLRFEDCRDLDEMMKCTTIFAIVSSPVVQAMFALHGYRMTLGLGSKTAPAAPAEGEKI